jgi:hypothetical protein
MGSGVDEQWLHSRFYESKHGLGCDVHSSRKLATFQWNILPSRQVRYDSCWFVSIVEYWIWMEFYIPDVSDIFPLLVFRFKAKVKLLVGQRSLLFSFLRVRQGKMMVYKLVMESNVRFPAKCLKMDRETVMKDFRILIFTPDNVRCLKIIWF